MNTSIQTQSNVAARSDSGAFVTQLFVALEAADFVTVNGYEASEHCLSDDGVWRMDTASGEPDDSCIWFKDQAVEVADGVLQATCTEGETYTLELQVKRCLTAADLAARSVGTAAEPVASPVLSAPVIGSNAVREGYDGNYVAIMQFMDDPGQTGCECGGGCNWKGFASELTEIQECVLTPGHASPAGRCPDCDSLAYVVEEKQGGVQ